MRAAFDDLAGNFDPRLARVEAAFFAAASRVLWNAARLRRVCFVLLRPPVGGPFPHVADHVVDAVGVGRERHHRRGALEAVLTKIFVRGIALPGVGAVLPAGLELIAPGELGAVESATRGVLPLGLN